MVREYVLNLWLKKLLEDIFVCWYGFRWMLRYNTNAKISQSAETINHIAMSVDKSCPEHRPVDSVSNVGWKITPLKSIVALTASTIIPDTNPKLTMYFALFKMMWSMMNILILMSYTNVPVNSGIRYKQSELSYLYVSLQRLGNVSLSWRRCSSDSFDPHMDDGMNLYVANTVITEIKTLIISVVSYFLDN